MELLFIANKDHLKRECTINQTAVEVYKVQGTNAKGLLPHSMLLDIRGHTPMHMMHVATPAMFVTNHKPHAETMAKWRQESLEVLKVQWNKQKTTTQERTRYLMKLRQLPESFGIKTSSKTWVNTRNSGRHGSEADFHQFWSVPRQVSLRCQSRNHAAVNRCIIPNLGIPMEFKILGFGINIHCGLIMKADMWIYPKSWLTVKSSMNLREQVTNMLPMLHSRLFCFPQEGRSCVVCIIRMN